MLRLIFKLPDLEIPLKSRKKKKSEKSDLQEPMKNGAEAGPINI